MGASTLSKSSPESFYFWSTIANGSQLLLSAALSTKTRALIVLFGGKKGGIFFIRFSNQRASITPSSIKNIVSIIPFVLLA